MSAPEPIRTMRCPRCGRVASVAPWCARPICVHAWENVAPEIWDGDDVNGDGRKIEDSPNEKYRTPGDTWEEMVPVVIPVSEMQTWTYRSHGIDPDYLGRDS